ncbi:phenylpropionate dioxygenase-like ring-hydroxylating dioxygenase large terminal subunit [Rhizobium sp. BK619]|uniref:Rieske (2Fe-2S) domain-containing protein n=2 Tax=Rhizobium leguminosarum TaxID=384 RepID=I9XBW1_RHILT|nr:MULTISPECIES: Rieske (2Fe-2S) protein [Rhizobium]EJB06516.1 Rieske (2Fe-2S) domain-containing protein [Rhizobium leguminosarum bv. trifolii WSM597]MBB3646607.1 phenylpropionate dioxygenase-like ring-hydroxylating dioxygenase large terminal subunit [Rhizobium sp. BK619]MBB5662123.1 phenylpropionate dioxygenase-like ring-hydroxylating dioxygenase large terminal subunit [Rhizobium leguminosarum]MBB6222850.1 phenylpropionate dioxygenase-like ring-hydroxylating dioxygenase large terminal subunit 
MPSDPTGYWTPVALSRDLPAATVMPARTASGSIALWRSASGRISASTDRCPHRGMRLSHGFVRGEALSCIYHGWSYGQAGNCLRIPAHPGLAPPETIRVATHEVEEAGNMIWVAVGTPASKPPRLDGLIPLRSLTAFADVAAIETAAGAKANPDGLIEIDASTGTVCLLSVQEDGQTLIHVLLKEDLGPAAAIGASRAAESLRRRAEDLQKKESAR